MMNLGENLGEIASDGSKINAVVNSANFNSLHFNAQSLVPKFYEIRNLIMDCDMNFSVVYDSLNVDDSVECFNSNLNRLFEDNVPNRRVVKSVVHNWMNEECICSAKRIRDLTYRAYREIGLIGILKLIAELETD
ncbi:uncharacterized protein LOC124420717 [Lucilia cuprina]|uniref:uncharacterized protein LOC124420717 n=1 Tax=Lucilia cuprina TaxID=7375 RepID=UPI001F06F058|nr:uncharacterized protein LOC124420717 [Lucilia cuprina]